MYKLFIIGALIAALAAPASGAGSGKTGRPIRAQALCPQSAVLLPGRDYMICGGRFWIRAPQTGQLVPVSFWRLQHLNDPADGPDRP